MAATDRLVTPIRILFKCFLGQGTRCINVSNAELQPHFHLRTWSEKPKRLVQGFIGPVRQFEPKVSRLDH